MVANLMIAGAVPIGSIRLSPTYSMNMVRKATEMYKLDKNDAASNEPSRKRRRTLPVEDRLRLRRIKNKESAQISRERAKLQSVCLEKTLNELQYQKMKLLLENETLHRENQELEDENSHLRSRLQRSEREEGRVAAAFKYASLVSIPQLKEWALPKVLFILMISVVEYLKANFWINQFSMPDSTNQQNSSTIINFLSKVLQSMIQRTIYLQHLMIFNG